MNSIVGWYEGKTPAMRHLSVASDIGMDSIGKDSRRTVQVSNEGLTQPSVTGNNEPTNTPSSGFVVPHDVTNKSFIVNQLTGEMCERLKHYLQLGMVEEGKVIFPFEFCNSSYPGCAACAVCAACSACSACSACALSINLKFLVLLIFVFYRRYSLPVSLPTYGTPFYGFTTHILIIALGVIQKARSIRGGWVCVISVTNCYEKYRGWRCQITFVT